MMNSLFRSGKLVGTFSLHSMEIDSVIGRPSRVGQETHAQRPGYFLVAHPVVAVYFLLREI